MQQPETITGFDAAVRLLEQIATRYIENGCRVVMYFRGIRIYDCKDNELFDQTFEVHACENSECGFAPFEGEYGRWNIVDRQRYLTTLQQKGLIV